MQKLRSSQGRIVFLCCLVVAGYFIYVAVAGAVRTHQLDAQEVQAEREVRALEDSRTYLDAIKNYVASDAYVEQQARRQLGYTRPGEIPFVVTSPQPPPDSRAAGDWWQRLFPR